MRIYPKKSTEEQKQMVRAYVQGARVTSLTKQFKIGRLALNEILSQNAVQKRTKSESCSTKHKINDAYFDHIDCEAKAYFLGFLYADGYNGEKDQKYKVALHLQERDVHILEAFKVALDSNHPIRVDKRKQACLDIGSKRLSESLTKWGCGRAKSFTLTFPEWMPEELLPHFIRGYIDGDGWISFRGEGQESVVGAVGSIPFIERLGELIENKCQIRSFIQKHHTTPEIIQVVVSGRDQTSTLLAWLYKDATIYLERKKRKAETVLTPVYYKTKPNGSDCHLSTLAETDVLKIKELILNGLTNRKIQSATKFSIDAINDVRIGRTWHHLTGWNERNNLGQGNPKGSFHGMAKLNESNVLEIKELILAGWSNPDIALKFDISKDAISKIRCGKIWAHVTGFVYEFQGKARKGEANPHSALTTDKVLEIKRLLLRGETGRYISTLFGISTSLVSSIKKGRSWSHL
jgi:uncharacterized protein YerC